MPPATKFRLVPGDDIRVYKENEMEWCGPVKIIRIDRKVNITDGKTRRTYRIGLSQVIPVQASNNDKDLKRLLCSTIRKNMYQEYYYITEKIDESATRPNSDEFIPGLEQEINELHRRGYFKSKDTGQRQVEQHHV